MAGADNALGDTQPQLTELEGEDRVSHVLHLSAGPRKDNYKQMKRQEAGERAGVVPFVSFQRRVISLICNPVS